MMKEPEISGDAVDKLVKNIHSKTRQTYFCGGEDPHFFGWVARCQRQSRCEPKDAKYCHFDIRMIAAKACVSILVELAPKGVCAIVPDEGMLFRTNDSFFVEIKRKLVDECGLWAIVSLPGGVFSTAGAGVKTNLLFFTKGKKTQRIWYYDLSNLNVGMHQCRRN